jgi:ankyrin repeat protein
MSFPRPRSHSSHGQTSEVLEAARCGQAGDVEEAILLGADISAADLHGMTCLHHAAARGILSIVDVLIRYGAPLNCTDDAGMAPLHSAVLHDRVEVVQVIIYPLVIIDPVGI